MGHLQEWSLGHQDDTGRANAREADSQQAAMQHLSRMTAPPLRKHLDNPRAAADAASKNPRRLYRSCSLSRVLHTSASAWPSSAAGRWKGFTSAGTAWTCILVKQSK